MDYRQIKRRTYNSIMADVLGINSAATSPDLAIESATEREIENATCGGRLSVSHATAVLKGILAASTAAGIPISVTSSAVGRVIGRKRQLRETNCHEVLVTAVKQISTEAIDSASDQDLIDRDAFAKGFLAEAISSRPAEDSDDPPAVGFRHPLSTNLDDPHDQPSSAFGVNSQLPPSGPR